MFGLGIPELIVILLLILLLVLNIWLPDYLRKKYPNKIWIGLILCFLFLPLGQLYVDGAAIWIIALFVSMGIFRSIFGDSTLAWLSTSILSAMIIYYRLLKVMGPKTTI